ncbi:hypothetical protein ACVWXN_010857 [Bradyrhizobium sp. i1.4.4]
MPTERLVAHVIDAKYHWHLPLYRQAQMLATHGIAIDRSTLAFWVGYTSQELISYNSNRSLVQFGADSIIFCASHRMTTLDMMEVQRVALG